MAASSVPGFTPSQLSGFSAAGTYPETVLEEIRVLRALDVTYSATGSATFGPKVRRNYDLHRYPNIMPYERNQFFAFGTQLSEGMIACSAPFAHKLRHFFKKLGESRVELIVNLVEYDDERAPQYTPLVARECYPLFGGVVNCTEQSSSSLKAWNVVQRYLDVKLFEKIPTERSAEECLHSSDEERVLKSYNRDEIVKSYEFTQIHISDWADRTAAEDEEMFALVVLVDDYIAQRGKDAKIAIHCSAGVGRTGQFYNSLRIYQMLKANPAADVQPFQIAKEGVEMRTQFGINHPSQYYQLYSFVRYVREQLMSQG